MSTELIDAVGRRRSPATLPSRVAPAQTPAAARDQSRPPDGASLIRSPALHRITTRARIRSRAHVERVGRWEWTSGRGSTSSRGGA